MNTFIHFRDGIRKFILQREMLFIRLWNIAITLVGLLSIKANFGYQKTISQTWVCVVLSLLGALLPIKGVAIVLMVVIVLDLMSLGTQVALVAVALIIIGYLVCAYFHSKNTYNMVTVPLLSCFNCPYAMTLGTGLMCNINELCSILCGSITYYYLHIIKNNAAAILDETSEVSVMSLLQEQMLMDRMFYFFIVAMIGMYLVVYLLRSASIRMSWIIANVAGVFIEFIIMLSGYLLTSQKSEIPGLILGNIIVLLVGVILNYFILDLDYSRIEKVQFEDDDYYYYVTAVPKIRISQEEKEVKKF